MDQKGTFKKPTIKATSRAYVRLYEYFTTPDRWLEFIRTYHVEPFNYGMRRDGDCAVRVIDPATREMAVLGLEIPNEIKYHNNVAMGRSFWNENFTSATHRRHRQIESGYAQAFKDEVVPR